MYNIIIHSICDFDDQHHTLLVFQNYSTLLNLAIYGQEWRVIFLLYGKWTGNFTVCRLRSIDRVWFVGQFDWRIW